MEEQDNLRAWMESEEARIKQLSAESAGFRVSQLPENWKAKFFTSLSLNKDAERLCLRILPKCRRELLAGFVVLTLRAEVETELLRLTKERGIRFKGEIRRNARRAATHGVDNQSTVKSARESLVRADRAFDIRRRGLAEYATAALIVREHLLFKSGLRPTARELMAIFKAGLAASDRPVFIQSMDPELLRRNLYNLARRRPGLYFLVSGGRATNIIELATTPSC